MPPAISENKGHCGHQPRQPCHASHNQRQVPGRLRMETGFPPPQSAPHGAPREDSGSESKDACPDPEAHVKGMISAKLDFCIFPYIEKYWVWDGEEDIYYTSRVDTCGLLYLTGVYTWRAAAEVDPPMLWPPDAKSGLMGKDPDAGEDGRWEEKGATEDEMTGWRYWLDGHEFEQALGVGDGQGGLVRCSPWGRKESDATKWLNWYITGK